MTQETKKPVPSPKIELFADSGCCSSCAPPKKAAAGHNHDHDHDHGDEGHDCESHGHSHSHSHEAGSTAASFARWGVAVCGVLGLIAWGATHVVASELVPKILYALAIIAGGWPLALGAVGSLRRLSLDMNVLMSVAVIGACILGDWGEAASLVFLYAVSQWIEVASVSRSRQAITQLMNLAPQRALVRRGGELVDTEADDVAIGDIFVVRAGERIALDGIVTEGASEINQAPVTGESVPVAKEIGSEVFAGTLNGGGVLEIRATRAAREGTVARIARLVAQAEREKSPRQTVIERFALRYTPIVLAVAVLVALLPPLFFAASWPDSVLRALALLVAACPCAFVISGPIATICALSAAARNGVLIRGSSALEDLSRLQAVAFDKTGTLTQGAPQVVDFSVVSDMPAAQALDIAAALERQSKHPLAQAFVRYADGQGSNAELKTVAVEEQGGQGVRGSVDGCAYRLGKVSTFAREGLLNGRAERVVERLQNEGSTVALLCSETSPLAVIGFRDGIRPEAKASLGRLKEQGVHSHIVLSGDQEEVVRKIAGEVEADRWYGGLLPEDKLVRIRELSKEYGMVAMVGDGINDAPALAAADIGVAMGAAGSDAALEVADVALMGDDLAKLPQAIQLSRRARGIIVQNIGLAFAMKLIFVIGLFLNAWGGYSLIGGVLADVGATLLVTANGLRLLKSGAM